MKNLDENFGPSLVKVIKKVARRHSDGEVKPVKQVFYVKKVAPTDTMVSKQANAQEPDSAEAPDPAAQDQPELQIPKRISVKKHNIPWKIKDSRKATIDQYTDPIPRKIRDMFDKSSISTLSSTSIRGSSSIDPADTLLWGINERDLLSYMKSGEIIKTKYNINNNDKFLAKIEIPSGGSFYCHVNNEPDKNSISVKVWEDLIDVSECNLSQRHACVYEIAKSCGLEDIVLPTVFRENLSNGSTISLNGQTLPSTYSSMQFTYDKVSTIDKQYWFTDACTLDPVVSLWNKIPRPIKNQFIRVSVLDFIIGSIDRSFGNLLFRKNERYPIIITGGELSLPCPRKIGLMHQEREDEGIPLYWSDFSLLLSENIDSDTSAMSRHEECSLRAASLMKSDTPAKLVRCLIDCNMTLLQIAGVLSRIWMLETFSREISLDLSFAAKYYSSIISKQDMPQMDGIRKFVNNSINGNTSGKFDFYTAMREKT
jgi:hypothetical protein